MPAVTRDSVVEKAVPQSGFSQLPKELLFKILEQLDDEHVLQCTEISFLNSVGVAILLQRHDIQDPSVYCEAEVRLREGFLDHPPADLLSALLASGHRYRSIKKLHCAVRPSAFYDMLDMAAHRLIPYEDPVAEPMEDRSAFMFGRIDEFMSRVDALEDVHLDVGHWRRSPECFSRSLERLINRMIHEKGCSSLNLDIGLTSFAEGHCWTASSTEEPPRTALALSRIIANLTCGLFGDSDSHFATQESQSSARYSQLTKLQMDSIFFHSKTLPWISNTLSNSRIVDFTVSLAASPGAHSSFFDHGFPILLRTTPHLSALALLQMTEESFRKALPHLHLFAALKHLTLCINIYYWPSSSPEKLETTSAPALFLPRGLESLSISPELIEHALSGIPTPDTNLKQIQIVYQEVPRWISHPPKISEDAASVREFFDKIQAPITIKVKLPMEGKRIPADGILPGTPAWRSGFRTVYADSLTRALKLLRRNFDKNGGKGFAAVDIFQFDCNPLELETRESIESCVSLVSTFPKVKEVVLQGARHTWEAHKPPPAYTLPRDVANDIRRRTYSNCAELKRLRIGEEVYLRPGD